RLRQPSLENALYDLKTTQLLSAHREKSHVDPQARKAPRGTFLLGRKKPETIRGAKSLILLGAERKGPRISEQLSPMKVETKLGDAKKL
ncbi:MAG: hypothetical protein K1X67_25855, partial [Fimbriimonadaceae bacterium]|nr:hypothetical protein [Fimbriimonadaceae bacterium]